MQFYFCQGQLMDAKRSQKIESIDDNSPLLARIYKYHRKSIAMAIPATAVYIIWLGLMIQHNYWCVFSHPVPIEKVHFGADIWAAFHRRLALNGSVAVIQMVVCMKPS